ncbi:Nuclear pore complex protein NUP155, partial [Zea mays]
MKKVMLRYVSSMFNSIGIVVLISHPVLNCSTLQWSSKLIAHYSQEYDLPNSLLVPSILKEKSIVSLTVISAWLTEACSDKITPHVVSWFTREATQDEEFEVMYGEDDDEDKDDEDDDDYDTKTKGAAGGGRAATNNLLSASR